MYHGKVDLHLHLDGSLSEDVVARLLQREGITMSREELQHNLRVEPECTSLVEYLQKFEVPGQVLQTEYGLARSDLYGNSLCAAATHPQGLDPAGGAEKRAARRGTGAARLSDHPRRYFAVRHDRRK